MEKNFDPKNTWTLKVKRWFYKVEWKPILQHIGLLLALMIYTVIGGLVFRTFESPAELTKISKINATLYTNRLKLVENIVNTKDNVMEIYEHIDNYSKVLRHAFENGFQDVWLTSKPTEESEKWNMLTAVFFSSTVLTTIGYGNIAPMTFGGRAFCIFFALIGIPLTLTVLADWGRIFATTLSTIVNHIPSLPIKWSPNESQRTSYFVLSAVIFLFVYLAFGAGIFIAFEDDWTFFDGFYFCFVTMTTIGFGDLVPKRPKYMLLCTLYILIGLALTSTIIELVRRQYAQSWRQIQALSGPFAEHLRRLAEIAPGLDILAFQQDLRRVLTVTSKRGPANDKIDQRQQQKEWEDAMEAVIRNITEGAKNKKERPVVQIVIYETSV
ncbi:TWiK family of potassium channels protein 7 [Onthophagus taurus]|uniref:TWiK family of potassium channels protein 7 n=1 Tax=Onthophagus taurus TaxID=166361 RepID=UPI000C2016D3|nr:TWiK family of potassium channels protein 7 [Onthophagus taurus]